MKETETGIVKSLRKDGKSVCIAVDLATGPQDSWLDLAENVKPQYIKVGSKCSFSYISEGEGNPIITYIKCEGSGNTYNKSYSKPAFKSADSMPESGEMARMSALKAAGNVFSGTGKEADFKRLTDEIVNYIKGGNWNTHATELIQKGKLPIAESEDY